MDEEYRKQVNLTPLADHAGKRHKSHAALNDDYGIWGTDRLGARIPSRAGRLGPRGIMLHNVKVVLKRHNDFHAVRNKIVGTLTKKQRYKTVLQIVNILHDAGYKVINPSSLTSKHAQYLFKTWEEEGLSASTLTNRHSILKTFMGWVGVDERLLPLKKYLKDPERAVRKVATETDKTWVLKDLGANLERMKKKEPLEYLYMSLMQMFGLRMQEAFMLDPFDVDDEGEQTLRLRHGTKGGRNRDIPVETIQQREQLIVAQKIAYILNNNGRLTKRGKSLRAVESRYYRVCHKYGITRKNGVVSHGLRHQYANQLYMTLADDLSPIKGGVYDKDNEQHVMAKKIVSKNLGHKREQITDAYIG